MPFPLTCLELIAQPPEAPCSWPGRRTRTWLGSRRPRRRCGFDDSDVGSDGSALKRRKLQYERRAKQAS